MVDYYVEKKDITSDFNEAKYQILRLHVLWQSCNNLSQSGQLLQWKWKLDAIWRELSPDAKLEDDNMDKEEEKYFNQVKKINKTIADSKKDTVIYLTLQEKEIFLRCLQEKVGKGGRRSSGDDDDIDN